MINCGERLIVFFASKPSRTAKHLDQPYMGGPFGQNVREHADYIRLRFAVLQCCVEPVIAASPGKMVEQDWSGVTPGNGACSQQRT